MKLINPLDELLTSRAKLATLRALAEVDIPLSGRELARRAGVAPGLISRVLQQLTATGLVSVRSHGSANTYQLERDAPLARELVAVFQAERRRYQAVLDHLVADLPQVLSVILFGSEARGDATVKSDTDLLLVVDELTAELREELARRAVEAASEQLLSLSWHVADLKQVRQWQRDDHPFWRNVVTDGVRLRGKGLQALVNGNMATAPDTGEVVLGGSAERT